MVTLLYKRFNQIVCCCLKSLTKLLKTLILGVQGHSRSSKLILLRSSSLLLVIISKTSVPICNCFNARRNNISKITTFYRSTTLLRLLAQASLYLMGQDLDCKSTLNAENYICKGLSPTISSQFTVEMCAAEADLE